MCMRMWKLFWRTFIDSSLTERFSLLMEKRDYEYAIAIRLVSNGAAQMTTLWRQSD